MRPLAALALASLAAWLGGEAARRVEEGNRAARDGRWEEAARLYEEAARAAPGRPEIVYDRGTARTQAGDPRGGAEDLARAAEAAEEPSLRRDALYNRGGALLRAGDREGAAEALRRALLADPDDRDAKRNLEIALRPPPEPPPRPAPGAGEDKEDEGERPPQAAPPEGGGAPMTEGDARRLLERLDELERDALRRQNARRGRPAERGGIDW